MGICRKSWYNTFLKDNLGEIKCRETIYKIEAKIPSDLADIENKINQAYLEKYDSGDNSFYAKGITEKEHAEKTMEFVILNNKN